MYNISNRNRLQTPHVAPPFDSPALQMQAIYLPTLYTREHPCELLSDTYVPITGFQAQQVVGGSAEE